MGCKLGANLAVDIPLEIDDFLDQRVAVGPFPSGKFAMLGKKNALISFRQIIRELESALAPVNSHMVLNGSQFGLFANHSLIMANYISRANAAIIDLRNLLRDG